jgi:hypothetical protein
MKEIRVVHSNHIDESDRHNEKQDARRVSTPRGIAINCDEDNENASLPIALTGMDCSSKDTDEGITIGSPDSQTTADQNCTITARDKMAATNDFLSVFNFERGVVY